MSLIRKQKQQKNSYKKKILEIRNLSLQYKGAYDMRDFRLINILF